MLFLEFAGEILIRFKVTAMESDGCHSMSRGCGARWWNGCSGWKNNGRYEALYAEVMMGGVLQRSFSVLFGKRFEVLMEKGRSIIIRLAQPVREVVFNIVSRPKSFSPS